jgi:hypothetical protein
MTDFFTPRIRENIKDTTMRILEAQREYDALKFQDGPRGKALRELIEVHRKARSVYRNCLPKGEDDD